MADDRRIAILGAGKIGESLISGLRQLGLAQAVRDRRHLPAPGAARRAGRALRGRDDARRTQTRSRTRRSSSSQSSPRTSTRCSARSASKLSAEQTVLSVAAAVTDRADRAAALERRPVVLRAMPNAPAIVHEGVAGICAGAHAQQRPPRGAAGGARRTSAASYRCPSRTWTRSRRSPARGRPTSRCSPRR